MCVDKIMGPKLNRERPLPNPKKSKMTKRKRKQIGPTPNRTYLQDFKPQKPDSGVLDPEQGKVTYSRLYCVTFILRDSRPGPYRQQ